MSIPNPLPRLYGYISGGFDWLISKKLMRFGILIFAGGAGWWLFTCHEDWILCLLGIDKTDRARDYLVLPMMSIFVVFALWVFRTYDTRQEIQQTNFTKGLDNLVSDNPLQVDIGVILLLEVSRATPAFDKEIRLAFIKRLKELPGDLGGRSVMEMRANRLSYAQYIIQWLIDHPKVGGAPLDIRGMDCRYQEFTSSRFSGGANKKLEISKIFSFSPSNIDDSILNPGITFEEANCENVSFKGVSLGGFDFTNAINVDITGGYIEHFHPRGLDGDQISPEDLAPQTGEVVNNPNWAEPAVLTDKCVQVRQENNMYIPSI